MINGSNLNISTANFRSNLTPTDKIAKPNFTKEQMQTLKSKEDVKKQIRIYQNRTIKELADKVIKVDESEEDWIIKAINQIDDILSRKYAPEQIKLYELKRLKPWKKP